jgi:phosphatidylserine decarboxylase
VTRFASRLTGKACAMYLPRVLRPLVYGSFGKVYGIDFSEMRDSIYSFPCFSRFFTRALKQGARKIDAQLDKNSMCSPCDGTVLSVSKINSSDFTFECVKGTNYSMAEFLLGEN